MNRRRRSLARKQHGFVLIALVALLVMGGLYFFISNLSPEFVQARRQQLTGEALAQARDALIGYAVRYREDQINDGQLDRVYGYLPLPDLGSSRNNNVDPKCNDAGFRLEGCDAASNTAKHTVIGRFPWRTLGTEPLRDGNGECLWYVVSDSHDRVQRPTPMNWDTLGQLDVVIANDSASLISALASAHDRPVAIIFSPGPPLPGQDRSPSSVAPPVGDDVSQCGGNYNPANYLDPSIASVLGGASVYFPGSSAVDTSTSSMALAIHGTIDKAGSNLHNKCPQGSTCTTVANDRGLALTNDVLFGALRMSSNFRLDINSMLDRMTGCLRDQIAAGSALVLQAPSATHTEKSTGRIPDNPCYDNNQDPRGYYDNYKDQAFVAACTSGACLNVAVDGVSSSCAGTLLFAGQRSVSQSRADAPQRNAVSNYLDNDNIGDGALTLTDNNLTSFTTQGQTTFAGPGQFARISSTHAANQDIVRCIPSGASMVAAPSALPPGAELSQYNPATRTLTLGRQNIESDLGYGASALFGCAWTPEARATGSGFRSYFKFNIIDSGDGFVFASIDGDRNSASVCGAGEQHLGYSGNNGSVNSPILYPKLGLEFDTRFNFRSNPPFVPDGFNPERTTFTFPVAFRTLANGRADPNYAGGHIGLVYWGGETPISTSDGVSNTCSVNADCLSPAFCDTGVCKLNQEEDDNVHGQLPAAPASRPPPRNPPLPPPATAVGTSPTAPPSPPPYPPHGVDKLDPSLSSVPTDQDIHVRVELARVYSGRDDNSRLVRVVASTNLASLSGLPTVDSIALQAGDTVLVTAQSIARSNGVYVAAVGAWTRAANADESTDLPPGTSWFIKEGTIYRGSLWRLQNAGAPVINSSDLVISLFRQPVKAVATTNLALTGLQTVDGVSLAAGDRVLLTAQTVPKENGVYIASAGAWSRATLESTTAGMRDGATWFATSGTGSYWRLAGDSTPGASDIAISLLSFPSNSIYFATVTTQVWKESSNVDQIARMQTTTRSMNELDPVVRHAVCLPGNTCPASSPDGQSCGGVETDGFRYCYTGQKPKLYDTKKVFDIRSATSCGSNASCTGNQFCGIDNVCYQPAFRTTRQGFTGSQSTGDQEIEISDFFTTWIP